MNQIDIVEKFCTIVILLLCVGLLSSFLLSVVRDIREAKWYSGVISSTRSFLADMGWMFNRLTGCSFDNKREE